MNHESGQIKFQIYTCIYISHDYELETVLEQKFRYMHVFTYQLYVLKLNLKLNFRFKNLSIHLMY